MRINSEKLELARGVIAKCDQLAEKMKPLDQVPKVDLYKSKTDEVCLWRGFTKNDAMIPDSDGNDTMIRAMVRFKPGTNQVLELKASYQQPQDATQELSLQVKGERTGFLGLLGARRQVETLVDSTQAYGGDIGSVKVKRDAQTREILSVSKGPTWGSGIREFGQDLKDQVHSDMQTRGGRIELIKGAAGLAIIGSGLVLDPIGTVLMLGATAAAFGGIVAGVLYLEGKAEKASQAGK